MQCKICSSEIEIYGDWYYCESCKQSYEINDLKQKKVKIFHDVATWPLEEDINSFISTVNLIDIKFNSCRVDDEIYPCLYAMIIYEDLI